MLKNVDWSDDRSYKSGKESEPIEFYLHGLCNSTSFDLLLGYFSSAAINVLSLGFATFLYNGGNVRLIVNNILSKDDRDTLTVAEEPGINEFLIDLSDIRSLHNKLDEYGRHFFECLAWLIAKKRIQLKHIRPKYGLGISHYKNGIFYDKSDYVGFSASCNFTAYGLLENLERLDAFLSWENSRSTKFVKGITTEFNDIFFETATHVEYLNITDIEIAIQNEFGHKDINDLLIQEGELINKRSQVLINKKLKKAFEKVSERIDEIESQPRFPFPEGPREYQKEAYENWLNNDCKGIFAMATGTGKTITALNCLLQESKKSEHSIYHAIILVPTITLVNQWAEEALRFKFRDIIKVSSKFQWESELATTLSITQRLPTSFIIITTYASFVKERFYRYLQSLPLDTLFIADEAHNTGSPSVLARLQNISLQKRIGLSATPKRIYDAGGSTVMQDFFNDSEPYIYSFSMEKAIEEGILCKYYYHPHIVKLTEEELKEYMVLTKKLSKFFNRSTGSFDLDDMVQMLLLKRKRLIHKAVNKLDSTQKILEDRFTK